MPAGKMAREEERVLSTEVMWCVDPGVCGRAGSWSPMPFPIQGGRKASFIFLLEPWGGTWLAIRWPRRSSLNRIPRFLFLGSILIPTPLGQPLHFFQMTVFNWKYFSRHWLYLANIIWFQIKCSMNWFNMYVVGTNYVSTMVLSSRAQWRMTDRIFTRKKLTF